MVFATLANQAVADTVRRRFLGKPAQARWAVPLPMPSSAEIAAQEHPWARRDATLEASTTIRGLPSCLPRPLAPPFLTCASDAIPFRIYAVAESTGPLILGRKPF